MIRRIKDPRVIRAQNVTLDVMSAYEENAELVVAEERDPGPLRKAVHGSSIVVVALLGLLIGLAVVLCAVSL
jgi:hypothetical protein